MRQALLGLLILSAACSAARAQWSVDWQTVDAGGSAEIAGGAWSMTATVGQHDTGKIEALDLSFSLDGGFWVGIKPLLPADYDGSGFLDADDFVLFVADFEAGCVGPGRTASGPEPACRRSADLDRSGFIDADDFVTFANFFGL